MSRLHVRHVVMAVVLGCAVSARAAPTPPDRPWAAGVSEDERTLALELYTQGNAEFAEARFAQALTKYREAIAHWDHPGIEFNIAVCLINLDQPLEARLALEKSLAFGADAIGPDAYAQALADRKLLDGRLAFVKISCREPQARVIVDGVQLFVGPGSIEQILLPGSHQIVAMKSGYATASESLFLSPGKQLSYDVRLVALTSTTRVVRRWPVWQPWAVLGGSVVLIGVGEIFHSNALAEQGAYDRALAEQCPHGCSPAATAYVDAIADQGKRYDMYSLATWSLAGVLATVGIAGVLLNEPHTIIDTGRPEPSVVPVAGGAVLSVTGGF
jgi:hypothetical protein